VGDFLLVNFQVNSSIAQEHKTQADKAGQGALAQSQLCSRSWVPAAVTENPQGWEELGLNCRTLLLNRSAPFWGVIWEVSAMEEGLGAPHTT
jgi:hypothetical protein